MVLHRAKNRLVKVEKCAAVFSSPPTVFYGLCNPHDDSQTRGGLNALKYDIGVSTKELWIEAKSSEYELGSFAETFIENELFMELLIAIVYKTLNRRGERSILGMGQFHPSPMNE